MARIRIVHNVLLNGWFIVRGYHQFPLSGPFPNRNEAQEFLHYMKEKSYFCDMKPERRDDTLIPHKSSR